MKSARRICKNPPVSVYATDETLDKRTKKNVVKIFVWTVCLYFFFFVNLFLPYKGSRAFTGFESIRFCFLFLIFLSFFVLVSTLILYKPNLIFFSLSRYLSFSLSLAHFTLFIFLVRTR